ncbi:MAG: acyl-CoA dehydrogenase family protein, partial [Thermoanaerobaculia bacterium]
PPARAPPRPGRAAARMNFQPSAEQESVRAMTRAFAEKEIAPGIAHREAEHEFPAALVARMGELGFLGMFIPAELGGAGFDIFSYLLAIEEVARVDASVAVVMSVTNSVACYPIWKFGTEEQKTTILRELASGECLGAYALTEPQSGSDAANQKTRAQRRSGSYLLNGSKSWITNAGVARWYVVMAMTDPGAGTRGITAFLVKDSDEGLQVGKNERKMGLHGSRTASIFFENLEIPESRRLGAEGEGFKIAMTTLDHSRIGIAAQSLGIARAAFEASVEHARTRQTFGKPLFEHQAIAFQIADMKVQIDAAALLTYRAACLSEHGGVKFSKESSMAKVFASEMCNAVCARACQIFGGYGYSQEYAVERYYRDARVTTIYEGTSEIQRMVISKNLLAEG